jgi:uncharacterized membrane protein
MITVALFILVVFLFLKVYSIASSMRRLEAEFLLLRGDSKSSSPIHAPTSTSLMYTAKDMESITHTQQAPQPYPTPNEVSGNSDVIDWLKENWLLKVGILMILAGFGWFVSYAFTHDWIGPVGRIMLGFISGGLLTIFGTLRASKNETQGNTFSILGSSLIIITALAGQYFYQFFPASLILAIIFLVSGYISFFAVVSSNQKLALYGIAMSLVAPYFSHTALENQVNFYAYLCVISIATIWVAVARGWRSIIPVGITGVFFYALQSLDSGLMTHPSKYSILFIVYIISSIYLSISAWSLIKNKIRADGVDMYLTILNTALMLMFTIKIVPTVLQSLVIAGWMIVYALVGALVFEKTKNEKLFYLHALASIVLLGVATSIELSGPTLVIAFSIEAAIISLASYVVTGKVETAEKFGLLMSIPFIMSIPSLTSYKWNTGVFHSDFAILAVMMLAFGVLGILYKLEKKNSVTAFRPSHLSFIMATFYAYALIWRSSHSIFLNPDSAVFMSLLIYTVIGLFTHFIGLFKRHVVLRNYGTTLLTLVVIRLMLIDVWGMDLSLRVITFVVLGTLFVSTAFISKKQNALYDSPHV